MKNYIITLLLLFVPAVTFAQGDTVLENMRKLTDENTMAILYVDLLKSKPSEAIETHRELLEKTAKDVGIDIYELAKTYSSTKSQVQDLTELWKTWAEQTRMFETLLIENFGIKEAFVVTTVKAFPIFGYVAIPKNDKLAIAALKVIPYTYFEENEDFVFLTLGLTDKHSSKQNLTPMIKPSHPIQREELVAAYQEVKDYPIWLVASPPKYIKKIFREVHPKLPASVYSGDLDITAITNAVKSLAVGVTPRAGSVHIVASMESVENAELVKRQFDGLFSYASNKLLGYVELLAKQKAEFDLPLPAEDEFILAMYPEILNAKTLAELQNAIIPQPHGARFVIHWNINELGTKISDSGILFSRFATLQMENFRENMRRQQCMNNLKQLALAVHNYYDLRQVMVPAYTTDKEGKPLHSWRVILLPYLEQEELYTSIRLDEPWDSEYNRQFHDKMPAIFRCASLGKDGEKRDTNYCMIFGEDAVGVDDKNSFTFRKIADGLSNTVLFVERMTPVCWMQPEDILQEDAYKGVNKEPKGIGSPHLNGANSAFCDAGPRFIPENLPLDVLKAIITKAGGEYVSF
ncbi:MAG: DUF1559 domain-containing protein [Thermoguttaceae bacterium]